MTQWREKVAELICKAAHEGQERKGGGPYFEHPFAVRDLTNSLFLDSWEERRRENLRIACLLHDVVEDTDFPPYLIDNTFGPDVFYLVGELTRGEKQSKEEYWEQIRSASEDVHIAKSLDVLHNLTSLPVFYTPPVKKMKPSDIKWTRKFTEEKKNMVLILQEKPPTIKFKSQLTLAQVLETEIKAVEALLAVKETNI